MLRLTVKILNHFKCFLLVTTPCLMWLIHQVREAIQILPFARTPQCYFGKLLQLSRAVFDLWYYNKGLLLQWQRKS